MLNPFPFLLTFSQIGPFIIRVTLGFLFAAAGARKLSQRCYDFEELFSSFDLPKPNIWIKFLGLIEFAGGIAMLAGFGTQIASIVLAVITLLFFVIKYRRPEMLPPSPAYYVLIFAMSLSLLVTGAGAFAFDLPL